MRQTSFGRYQTRNGQLCWGDNVQPVKKALRLACKGSKDDMITLARFVCQVYPLTVLKFYPSDINVQEIRCAGRTVRFQKMPPLRPLQIQAEECMQSLESPHAGHPKPFLQLKSLLSRIGHATIRTRMNAICTALVDFARVQPWPKQNSKPRLELYWTIRHLMMTRCHGIFSPLEIEEAMELAEYISRNESDPIKRLRIFAAH